MEYKDLAGQMEHKVKRIHREYNEHTGATYGWLVDDDDTTTVSASPAGPSGVDQVDGARLELAMSAGRAAIAAGFGQSSRADGKLACGHCTKCDQARPDLCRQPMEPVVAKALAAQARADRIAEAEADAADMARVIWQQQAARGRVF